jgi:RNA polymerase sigma-70 factor (ECF subfamily)
MDEASDEELMGRIGRGDEGAFRLIVRRHAARAIALARRVVGSDAEAEDIAQDALLRVWINAPRWRPTAAFRTWFYRVVLNLCLNRRRGRSFVSLEQAGDPADPSPGVETQLDRAQSDRAIAAAVDALPERQRLAIVLTYGEGLANAEVAAVLDTTVSGVETLLVRARRTMRERLTAHIPD